MSTAPDNAPDSVRVPDHQLDQLAATVAQLVKDSDTQSRKLDHLASELPDVERAAVEIGPSALTSAEAADDSGGPASVFILALDNTAYGIELAALTAWVDHLLLPVYGREITTGHPWCYQWREHPEAVARLHGLWLAWQQCTDVEAGLAGPSLWHRDHHEPAMLQLRAADGPFAACTTNAGRPNHRLLPAPTAAAPAPVLATAPRPKGA